MLAGFVFYKVKKLISYVLQICWQFSKTFYDHKCWKKGKRNANTHFNCLSTRC